MAVGEAAGDALRLAEMQGLVGPLPLERKRCRTAHTRACGRCAPTAPPPPHPACARSRERAEGCDSRDVTGPS